jgi:hypothetical protein
MDIPDHIIRLSLNFLTDREQRVRVDNSKSEYSAVHVGISQGTTAGLLFWLAFINTYQPDFCEHIKYADDIICFYPLSDDHAYYPDTCDVVEYGMNWCKENSMLLNLQKTKVMSITLKQKKVPENPPDSEEIERVNSWKFLGVTIDQTLSFEEHITDITKTANSKMYFLVKLKQFGVSVEKLCQFYLANVRSTIVYGTHLLRTTHRKPK